jgi:type IV pilus assembly protein PilO
MASTHDTRRKVSVVLGALLLVDVLALVALFSPLVGSTNSRQAELNQLRAELKSKTLEVKPLGGLDEKIKSARQQIATFYKDRLPARESDVSSELGKVASTHSVRIATAKYELKDTGRAGISALHVEANLEGDYIHLVRFINALERDRVFFVVNSVSLGEAQGGQVRLQLKLDAFLKAGA